MAIFKSGGTRERRERERKKERVRAMTQPSFAVGIVVSVGGVGGVGQGASSKRISRLCWWWSW